MTPAACTPTTPALDAIERWITEELRAPVRRTLLEFAEQEIVIPDGDFEGLRYRTDRQPMARLLLQELPRWKYNYVLGCTQSGKSLSAFIIPLLYVLFELKENVILGLPDADMANDKWKQDILPVILAAPNLRQYLPDQGTGSRGGNIKSGVEFSNGATLKVMTGGSGDKGRAAFTARVLCVTETDGFDAIGGTSKETNKLGQLMGRTLAFDGAGTRWHIFECTVTDELGSTWQGWKNGTESRLAMPCPHCGEYVTLGRGDLVGWQDARDVLEAREKAHWVCCECHHAWTDAERVAAAQRSVLVHRGQTVDSEGIVHGPTPRTETLGFRWSAVDNLFWTAGSIGAAEWDAAREEDVEIAERRMLQQYWAVATDPAKTEVSGLTYEAVIGRGAEWVRNEVPPDTQCIVTFLDLGTRSQCHWGALALRPGFTPHVVDYGVFAPSWMQLGEEKALLAAMAEYRARCQEGFGAAKLKPTISGIDLSGSWAPHVYKFCRQFPEFIPVMGFGRSQVDNKVYSHPNSRTGDVRLIGERYHKARIKAEGLDLLRVDADYWKSFLLARCLQPTTEPGAFTLFKTPGGPRDHTTLGRHFTAERIVREHVADKGWIEYWIREKKDNHFFDVFYDCCALGHLAGARLVDDVKHVAPSQPRRPRPAMTMPDGRAFLATER